MTILLITLLILSIGINILLIWYTRKMLNKFYYASVGASEIFTKFDTYREHLKTIFELELFYGDKNLKEVIEHTKEMLLLLKKYNGVFSFTQADLEDILKEEDTIQDDENNREEKTKESK